MLQSSFTCSFIKNLFSYDRSGRRQLGGYKQRKGTHAFLDLYNLMNMTIRSYVLTMQGLNVTNMWLVYCIKYKGILLLSSLT